MFDILDMKRVVDQMKPVIIIILTSIFFQD